MKKSYLKIITLCLGLCMTLSVLTGVVYAQDSDTIVILYENDVHCEVNGYSKLAAMKHELAETFPYVGIVSVGDFVQGGTLGAVSRGEYIVNLMNQVGYDAIALGNHEFDYMLPRLNELNELSNTKYLSCNFQKIGEDRSYFDPYKIVSYGDVDIAYIAVTTPETINSSSPAQFMDENGELLYTFQDAKLYDVVQATVDAAKTAGADYVIALSHIGYDESGKLTDITDLIENTDGLDVVLDAHSHSVMEEKIVKDKSGEDVLLTSTGTKFANIGKLTIQNGTFDTELVAVEGYTKTDPAVDALIAEITENYAQLGNRKIAESKVELITNDKDGKRLVRNTETNLGDLCADALRVATGADISFVNGGGLRAPIMPGDVTFNDIYSVFPFNNQIVTAEITGQLLLDFLELAMANYPEENGTFPHMAGITFSVDQSIPSSVKLDANGFFEKVDGAYRVYHVMILDSSSGEYQELDLNGTYTFAGANHYLLDFGGGAIMFKDAKILEAEGKLDIEVLESFIVEQLGGVIGEEYAQMKPNITFTDGRLAETTDSSEAETVEPFAPQTGDRTAVWFLWSVLSLFGLTASEIYRRKQVQ